MFDIIEYYIVTLICDPSYNFFYIIVLNFYWVFVWVLIITDCISFDDCITVIFSTIFLNIENCFIGKIHINFKIDALKFNMVIQQVIIITACAPFDDRIILCECLKIIV